MATIFSETLTRLRTEAGFPTAYRFFHSNGGAPVLKISYRKYLSLEQGKNLPVFGRLRGLLFGLRMTPKSPAANDLVTAWLKTLTGEDSYKEILEPLLDVKPEPTLMSPMHEAMKNALAGEKHYLSPAQLESISGNRDNYICFLALSNDTDAWPAEKLAHHVGLSEKSTEKALKSLKAVKLLKEAGGRYKCPMAAKMLEYPHMTATVRKMLGRLNKFQDELADAGTRVWRRRGILRADADTLCGFFPIMSLNLSAAHTYGITKKTKKSAVYFIEGRIVKLYDF